VNTTLAIITALGTLVTVIGGVVLQVIAALRTAENGRKLDENTQVTKAAAKQIDEVHAATNVLTATTSGTYKALIEPDAK
jgi:hypothetical protein